jgi:hypothetical protein
METTDWIEAELCQKSLEVPNLEKRTNLIAGKQKKKRRRKGKD